MEVFLEALLKTHGEISIVFINGSLDIEKTQPFRQVCEQHLAGKKVIFNLKNANFVGSTGIQSFIDSLRILGQSSQVGTRLVGLKPEFKRIFSNLEIRGLEIHESENEAILSFTAPRPVAPEVAARIQSPLAELDLDPEVGE
jgi:anti-anti-sigma factor